MRYLLIIILFASCCYHNRARNMTVYMSNGKGWNRSSSYIYVDSVTNTTPTSATIWIDGRKTTIYSETIMIGN